MEGCLIEVQQHYYLTINWKIMRNRVIKVIGGVLIGIIIHQVYWFNELQGNLIIYACNVSEKDSVKIKIYLDGEKISNDIYSNDNFYFFKKRILTRFPGKHKVVAKTYDDKNIKEYEFYSFFIKRVIVEYQGEHNQLDDENSEFLIDSHSVFGSLIIR